LPENGVAFIRNNSEAMVYWHVFAFFMQT